MRYSDVFGSCHPAVNFLYFVLVIAFSMCLTHPVCLLLSVCGAVIYHAVLLGPRSLRKSAVWMVPMAVLAAVINPAFTHQGVTILAYLPSGNPLTLESMLYGLASAALLSATLLWFTCYNTVMTSDKFIYLFGRVIPALSLVLSMTMRFVPRFRTQLHTVAQAQKYMRQAIVRPSCSTSYQLPVARVTTPRISVLMRFAVFRLSPAFPRVLPAPVGAGTRGRIPPARGRSCPPRTSPVRSIWTLRAWNGR